MRVCWNRQTGTFEGRVSTTYGFKSHHSHHMNKTYLYGGSYLFFVCMMGLEVGAVVNDSPVDCQSRK